MYISRKFPLSAISSLTLLQSKGRKRQILWKQSTKSFVSCFAIIFSIKTLWKKVKHPHCFTKRNVSVRNLMFRKCYSQRYEKSLTGRQNGVFPTLSTRKLYNNPLKHKTESNYYYRYYHHHKKILQFRLSEPLFLSKTEKLLIN